LQKVWRYAVRTDFHGLDPGRTDPIETVTLTYETHERFVPFLRRDDQSGYAYAISSDERWLAHGIKMTIDLYDLSTGERVRTLMGHIADIESLAFSASTETTILVSSATSDYDNAEEERAEIIVWDLKDDSEGPEQTDRIEAGEVARDAVDHIQARLAAATPSLSLEPGETTELTTSLEKLLGRFISRSSLPSTARRLSGRLSTSFQSPIFNNAGTALTILPAYSPPSNGDAQWDIRVHDLVSGRETILTGHRDSIMWIGFSPDDSLIVSACWDGTFRVWRADTGEQVHVWTTDRQNWAGCFAPDNERFMGTDGDGKIRIWSLSTGELLWSYQGADRGGRWRRHVDWSPDGKYILVGGEEHGEILLLEVPTSGSDVGPVEPAQRRLLSLAETRMDDDMKSLAEGMLGVASLQFVSGEGNDEDVMFGSTTYSDAGVEFVSLTRGKKWRIVPFERTEDDEADYDRLRREGWGSALSWSVLKKTGQVVVVNGDGLRFWKLT
jgi:WD40 repeat protein